MRRGAGRGSSRGGGRRRWSEDVVAGDVHGRRRGRGRAWRRVRVVRARVGAEAGHGQRGAVRGRAYSRLARRAARQRRRVVQRAHRRLPAHRCTPSIRLRSRLRWNRLCMRMYIPHTHIFYWPISKFGRSAPYLQFITSNFYYRVFVHCIKYFL